VSTTAWVVIGVLAALVLGLTYLAGVGKGSAATYEWLRTERMQQEVNQAVLGAVWQMQAKYDQTMDEVARRVAEPEPVPPPTSPPSLPPKYQVVVERPPADGYGWVAGWSES